MTRREFRRRQFEESSMRIEECRKNRGWRRKRDSEGDRSKDHGRGGKGCRMR